MSIQTARRSGSDQRSRTVQVMDPLQRLARYGRLQPMDEPSLLERLFRRQ